MLLMFETENERPADFLGEPRPPTMLRPRAGDDKRSHDLKLDDSYSLLYLIARMIGGRAAGYCAACPTERRFLSDASISIHLCSAGSNMRGIESREGDLQGPSPTFDRVASWPSASKGCPTERRSAHALVTSAPLRFGNASR
jgi:hypothetical protein